MLAAALILVLNGSLAIAGTFSEVRNFGSNPGNLKMFTYVPDELQEPAPLVVVLHGATQSARSYLHHSGWKGQADEGGFALLLRSNRSREPGQHSVIGSARR
jgi:poly(3-hydroxybutyrate) depolymerase